MKKIRLVIFLLPLVALCGCSGINSTQSVSPLDFLLPGLHIRNDAPAAPAPGDATNAPSLFAHPGQPVPRPLS